MAQGMSPTSLMEISQSQGVISDLPLLCMARRISISPTSGLSQGCSSNSCYNSISSGSLSRSLSLSALCPPPG